MANSSRASGREAQGDSRTYEVGYGRPPKSTQFKKGISGNPGGKPKAPRPDTPGSLLHATLARPVTITENGIRRKIPALELIYLNLVRAAARGDMRAVRILSAEIKRYPAAAAEADSHDWGAEVRQKLNDMLKRFEQQKALDAEADAKRASLEDDPPRGPGRDDAAS